MPPSIALARAGGTTGEWGDVMRERRSASTAARPGSARATARPARSGGRRVRASIPTGPPRFLVAKPGLDGHSNGAEQIAVAARDSGMEVVYSGIRLTAEQIAASARDEDPDVIGLSILSGSHLDLVPDVLDSLRAVGVDAPVVVGGIIPEDDRPRLIEWASPRCTRRRTSSSRRSCARSPSWPPPTAPAEFADPRRRGCQTPTVVGSSRSIHESSSGPDSKLVISA